MQFFAYAYDEREDAFERFATLDEARLAAEKHMAEWRQWRKSFGRWPDEPIQVFYGLILGQAVQTDADYVLDEIA